MIFNIDFLVFHSEQKGSDCTEESMRISLPNYFVARNNERNAEGLRRFAEIHFTSRIFISVEIVLEDCLEDRKGNNLKPIIDAKLKQWEQQEPPPKKAKNTRGRRS